MALLRLFKPFVQPRAGPKVGWTWLRYGRHAELRGTSLSGFLSGQGACPARIPSEGDDAEEAVIVVLQERAGDSNPGSATMSTC